VFAWIDAEKAEFPITKLCQYLHVSKSGFYASRGRPESAHTHTDRRLRVLVRASFDESRQRYGSPRIHEDLIEQAERVSRKRVIRLMQEDGLEARARKRFKRTTMSDHDQPVAANLLDRRFEAPGPNQRWVGDTTEFVIGGRRQALSRGRPRPLLAVRRGLGGQRRQ
jgi:putative transposase